jgi:myo-inositol-1(or 4)-monophosphatase
MASAGALDADWLAFSRRATEAARNALKQFPELAERSRHVGRGEGGDMTLAIDGAVEDAIFEELERFGVGVCVVSEERGVVEIAGGGPVRVVIDPIDGSLNAKRRLPLYSISIAVADGDDMSSVVFGYVADLARGEEWWAARGEGAWCNGVGIELDPGEHTLEILGVEYTRPQAIAANAEALAETDAQRLRMLGSIALALCYVASGRFDGLISLRGLRSVDVAAGQLIAREAGGVVAFPDAGYDGVSPGLDLAMRSSVLAATSPAILERLMAAARKVRR